MGKYLVTSETYCCEKAIVTANNVDEAEEKFKKGEVDESWLESGVEDQEVLSVESIN